MKGLFRAALAVALLCVALSAAPTSHAAQIVARVDGMGVTDIPAAAISPIPPPTPLGLIIPPGVYSYNGLSYEMTSPGLHFFMASTPGYSDGGHRIVWTGDVESFMRAASWLIRYGRTDEGLSASGLTQAMRERTVALRCGPASAWLIAQAQALGFQARIVRMLTMETPNDFDDGHIAVEARIGGQWVLFDVPNDTRFTVPSTGLAASLKHVADLGYDGLTPVALAPFESAPTPWSGSAFATEVYFNLRFRNAAPAWMRRIYQAVGVDRLDPDGVTRTYWRLPVGAESRKAWVESLSPVWKVIPAADWNAAFYP
jgi:hypothetical protein